MSDIQNISRRTFIKNVGLASGGLILACNYSLFSNENETQLATEFNPNLFVQLNPDGSLIIIASRSEMGNGVRTSLTSVVADEMEADWNRVTVKQAVGDKKYGDQNTDGSRSVTYLYETMRKMGAMTRMMLISAAAKKWQVPESECTAQNHFIIHSSGKKIGFGELVDTAKTLPIPTNIIYKNPKDFKYIGKTLKSVDIKNFVNGSATYGIDKRLPNMKFVAIARCPVTFGTVKSFNKTAAMKIRGLENVIELQKIERPFGPLGGIAVIASNTWAAFKGKEALEIQWNYGKNEAYDSEKYMAELTERVHKEGKVDKEIGDVNKAFGEAVKVVESTFKLPHLAHAPMEVPNAVAWVQGDSCEVWAPTQSPQTARDEVVNYLGTAKEKVTVNVTFLGGGFGRKSKPDYIVEAVMVSKAINAPVQVIWSREDDIKHGYYHTVSSQYMKASLDAQGNVTGWLHRSAFPSIMSTFNPGTEYPAGWEISSAADVPFDIKNLKIEFGQAPAMVRIGWMRSVINILHGFSINVFADELAHAAQQDPLEFRLKLIGEDRIENTKSPLKYNTARLKNVLKLAAKNANWGKPLPKGHAHGLAVHYSFNSYVASVVEISLIEGKVKTHNVHTVIDCGTAVNRDTIKSQLEGAAIFGMSIAYYGKITAKDGAIEQNSYSDYRMVRMNEIPNVHVEIVESTDTPTGVGEPGVPVIAPAIINAIFKLTGKRYYNLPLSDYELV
ncbi:xanthine dehydrogenase family protein molybdopterin-binding subunit [Flavobacterium gilvum]|uniref:Twin-arginine translocation pathway signal protein n=1 Tax=Flavobacterium gilvum TaxID=1492737 RepID=A0AAC9N4Q6_9FLAO|nr:molybdopterin cofactor-binding domain-containing protein [Flavobacterium gilvum]AOW11095.1 twin-arginine translocation pathway signal protein [Flavobacterium gilvum]KFC61019.1 twin-arginine translocation pathway signal protein [Flavobacterium gilvum]